MRYSKKRLRELERVCHKLGTLVGQGVPITDALDVVATESRDREVRGGLLHVLNSIRAEFREYAEVAAEREPVHFRPSYPFVQEREVFPRVMVLLWQAGETGGTWDTAMLAAAELLRRELE